MTFRSLRPVLTMAALLVSAAACSPSSTTEVIAGSGDLQSDVVSSEPEMNESVPTESELPATTTTPSSTAIDMPTTWAPSDALTNPSPGCVAFESFLLNDLAAVDDMSDEMVFATIDGVLRAASEDAAASWQQLEAIVNSNGDELTDEEISAVMTTIDDATMNDCGLPLFAAVVALDAPSVWDVCSYAATSTEDSDTIEDDSDCPTPIPPNELPCFAGVELDSTELQITPYAAVDCDSGERVSLTSDGTWKPTEDVTTTPTTTLAAPTTTTSTTIAPTTVPEYMTTTTTP
ncbi:MAG: hypothetical protein R2733_14075 [Acidimicrobiales bacterium]